MIEGQDIVCFSTMNWDCPWTSRQYIMHELATHGNRVLFVNPGVNLAELLLSLLKPQHYSSVRESVRHLVSGSGVQQVEDNVWTFTCPYLPRFSCAGTGTLKRLMNRVNASFLLYRLKRKLRQLGFDRPIVWNSFVISWMVEIIDRLDAKLLIYHCTDQFATEDPTSRAELVEWEKQMLAKADLVFSVSQPLYEAKQEINHNTYLVYNGVSSELISRIANLDCAAPADIAWLRRPRIGVVGIVSYRYDLDLLGEIARRRRDWSVVIIGPVQPQERDTLERLLEEPNLHWLGAKRPEELAGYLVSLDVGLLPYRWNQQTAASCPLKLLEYFAAGLPVVSVPLTHVTHYEERGLIACASGTSEFIEAVSRAMLYDSAEKRRQRMSVASMQTWDKQVEQMSAIIGQCQAMVQLQTKGSDSTSPP